jgi:hypothetical protein
LNITGKPGGLTKVYCFMEEDETCPAGSTLVLKIDGTKVRTEREGQEFSKKRTRGRNLGKYTMIKLFFCGGGVLYPYERKAFLRSSRYGQIVISQKRTWPS